MSRKNGFGKFLLGLGIGAGAALLFAPQEGSKTRKELKEKLDNVLDKVKAIDPEDVKASIIQSVEELRMEVEDLDKEKALSIAKNQAKKIEKKANELYDYAKEAATPVVENAVKEAKDVALKAAKQVVTKLEEEEKTNKKEETKPVSKTQHKNNKAKSKK